MEEQPEPCESVRPKTWLFFLVVVVVAAAWWWHLRPREAVALLRVSDAPRPAFFDSTDQAERDYQVIQRTVLNKLRSQPVLEAVLARPEMVNSPLVRAHDDPVEWLRQSLDAEFLQNSEILCVKFEAPYKDADYAAKTLDAVVQEFLTAWHADEQAAIKKALESIQASYGELDADQEQLAKRIAELKRQQDEDSPKLREFEAEMERSVKQAKQVKEKIEAAKVEMNAPCRIRLIQPATLRRS
jgi:aminopeptidase N